MPENHLFLSPLAILIESFIAEKRAVGYKFKKGAALLKRFDSFAYSYGLTEVILTKQLVIEWTVRKPNEGISTQCGSMVVYHILCEILRG